MTAFTPTLYSNPDGKDQYYNALDNTKGMLTPSEHIYLLGDFNARVGTDNNTWPKFTGLQWCWKNKREWGKTSRAML